MTLALEPEAAALFTKEQELIRETEEERVTLVPFVPQSKFMVVDLGGKRYTGMGQRDQSKKLKNTNILFIILILVLIAVHYQYCCSLCMKFG